MIILYLFLILKDWNRYLKSYELAHSKIYYKCYVPDSCCYKISSNCAQKYHDSCASQSELIHTNGCLHPFMKQLIKDILFLGAFTVSVSSFAILIWIINLILYFLIRARK